MKPAHLGIALLVVSILFAFAPKARAVDCPGRELPDGGCPPSGSPTPRPSGTTIPPFTSTPRPATLSASVVCNPATHYNDVTVTIRYAGSTEVWTESDMWFGRKEAAGTGSGNRTVVFHWSATFNKAGIFLFAPGVTWPAYQDPSRDPIASVTVHAIWGPQAPGC